jgi:cold shock CspA family protein/ribosome-associated translation inhibitor RaiA
MKLTPSITFRGLPPSPALETEIRRRIARLETYYPAVTGCRVLVELAQKHHAIGNHYHVRIDLTVPGEEIVVAHDASRHGEARDQRVSKGRKDREVDPQRKHAAVAVHEAFDAARRRLQDYARRQRGVVKTSVRQPRGRVVRIFPEASYGFIRAADGHEVYFQRTSVLNHAFDRLTVDSPVSFAEEAGENGPQASTVRRLHPRLTRRPRPLRTGTSVSG